MGVPIRSRLNVLELELPWLWSVSVTLLAELIATVIVPSTTTLASVTWNVPE